MLWGIFSCLSILATSYLFVRIWGFRFTILDLILSIIFGPFALFLSTAIIICNIQSRKNIKFIEDIWKDDKYNNRK